MFIYILADYPLNGNSQKFFIVYCSLSMEKRRIYKRIRNLREDYDLTQAKLGEILSCSQRVYSDYERGVLDIPTEILIKLADYYNVSVDYLLDRTNRKEINK